jgi:heterodisulfide reductase subunit A
MTQKRLTPHTEKTGSIAIIGSGIAGIQTALDIANSGFSVHLVEEKANVGGVMAQLDKTFPTNDCSSCMMGPVYRCSQFRGGTGPFSINP